jgi:hypothetical protein
MCAERLRARNAYDDDFARLVDEQAEERASELRRTLLSAPVPHPGQVFDLVYANPPESLLREKERFLAALEPEAGQ